MRPRLIAFLLVAVAALSSVPVLAQELPPDEYTDDVVYSEAADPAGTRELDAVVVGGRQPGPGLWKVMRGDNVLWILGVQSPLPNRMEWDDRIVGQRIAESQQVLMSPTIDFDADVGFFRGLTLLPSLYKARENPDGKLLREVVPAEQYARWQPLKQRWIGRDDDVEEWRPVFAALELYRKAIDRSGLTLEPIVSERVRKTARRAGVPVTTPTLRIQIKDPKQSLRDFRAEAVDDQECFRRTLDRIERDLAAMRTRANAWASGDMVTLSELPSGSQFSVCSQAFSSSGVARRQGITNLPQRIEALWLAEVDKALANNASTFAVMPISTLMQDGGAIDKLLARGYRVEAP